MNKQTPVKLTFEDLPRLNIKIEEENLVWYCCLSADAEAKLREMLNRRAERE